MAWFIGYFGGITGAVVYEVHLLTKKEVYYELKQILWMITLIFVAASMLVGFAKEKLAIWLGYGETLPAFEFVKAEFGKNTLRSKWKS